MNKNLKKIINVLCSAVIVAAFAVGCSEDQDQSKDNNAEQPKSDVVQSILDMNLPIVGEDYTVNLGYYN